MTNLTLAEKCYLVAQLGDVPRAARARLLEFAEIDPSSGVLIGGIMVGTFEGGKFALRLRPSLLDR